LTYEVIYPLHPAIAAFVNSFTSSRYPYRCNGLLSF